ncbi:MAG: serine/threonine-protein kinase [Deltaproteobacteria bacterium]
MQTLRYAPCAKEPIVAGRYALLGQLGEGGMGRVYRARHIELGKVFALKVIAPAFAGQTEARARFNQEAKLASEIKHPNIVSIVDYGEDPSFGAFMVMELVEGERLCSQCDPMSVRRTLEILGQIADALDHVHKRGIVHGDVKAENIVLATESTGTRRHRIARLLDFGLARRGHEDGDRTISGTPAYLAPERIAGGPANAAADVYALGVLGYLLLTGTLPFTGSLAELYAAHLHGAIPNLSEQRGEKLDDAVEALILRALARNPANRHASASAFLYELNTVAHMLGLTEHRRPSRPSLAPNRDVSLASVLELSRLPQALVSADGDITWANSAFTKLVGRDRLEGVRLAATSLASTVPGLVRGVRRVHITGRARECRARVARKGRSGLDVIVWVAPLPVEGSELHLVVRVEEIEERIPLRA